MTQGLTVSLGVQIWLITMYHKASTAQQPINESVADRPASVAFTC